MLFYIVQPLYVCTYILTGFQNSIIIIWELLQKSRKVGVKIVLSDANIIL